MGAEVRGVAVVLDVAQGGKQAQLQFTEFIGLLGLRIVLGKDKRSRSRHAAGELVHKPVGADRELQGSVIA